MAAKAAAREVGARVVPEGDADRQQHPGAPVGGVALQERQRRRQAADVEDHEGRGAQPRAGRRDLAGIEQRQRRGEISAPSIATSA